MISEEKKYKNKDQHGTFLKYPDRKKKEELVKNWQLGCLSLVSENLILGFLIKMQWKTYRHPKSQGLLVIWTFKQ